MNLFTHDILGNAKKCNKHTNWLHQFCLLIQDWGSVIMFSPAFITQHFPSVDVQNLVFHFDFKHKELGSHLIDFEVKKVKDCTGNPVLYEGSCSDTGNREKYLSAVLNV